MASWDRLSSKFCDYKDLLSRYENSMVRDRGIKTAEEYERRTLMLGTAWALQLHPGTLLDLVTSLVCSRTARLRSCLEWFKFTRTAPTERRYEIFLSMCPGRQGYNIA